LRFELNAVYVAGEPDVDAAITALREISDEDLLSAMKENPLALPWETTVSPWDALRGSGSTAPWIDDDEIMSAAEDILSALAQGRAALEALSEIGPHLRDSFLTSVRAAAEQWIRNVALLARGESATYEMRYANRIAVDPQGSIMFCPEDFETIEPTDANVFGEILLACRDVFPDLANAMGIHSLCNCRLSVDPLPND
jgi:hypothetical protein